MARVTVEDCIEKVTNRFELVMLAAKRARSLSAGAELTLERDDDKNPVVALREIAEETINLGELEEGLIKGLQKHVGHEEVEEEERELLADGDSFGEQSADVPPDQIAGTGGGDAKAMPRFDDNIDLSGEDENASDY